MKITQKWFTLIEVLLGILIFTVVILWWFQALSAINIGKIKLIERSNMTKDVVYFSEKLFEEIKSWGTIDYEEYFNRKVVGTTTASGHYSQNTWFWNFSTGGTLATSLYGTGFYYCRSGNAVNMGTGGCYNTQYNSFGQSVLWSPQRYGQYAFQFIDYNSNMNSDLWDQDGDGLIRWDDDDEHIGEWPIVFTWGENVREIYLISSDKKVRTFLRWSWIQDPKSPKNASNNYTYPCNGTSFWSGCLWTIEVLKLEWKDMGLNHNGTGTWAYDGIVDTWVIHEAFWTWAQTVAGTNTFSYRQPLFPDSVNVSDFQVYLYPNIDVKHAWKDVSASSNINPYLRLSITLEPSWKKRSGIQWEIPKYTINTTINLADYFTY